jgi:hypothetical protein
MLTAMVAGESATDSPWHTGQRRSEATSPCGRGAPRPKDGRAGAPPRGRVGAVAATGPAGSAPPGRGEDREAGPQTTASRPGRDEAALKAEPAWRSLAPSESASSGPTCLAAIRPSPSMKNVSGTPKTPKAMAVLLSGSRSEG